MPSRICMVDRCEITNSIGGSMGLYIFKPGYTQKGQILVDPGQYEHHQSACLHRSADIQCSYVKLGVLKTWFVKW